LDGLDGKGWLMTAEVANRLGQPVQTVLRSLQDMAAHGLVEQWQKPRGAGEEKSSTLPYHWRLSDQGRKWAKQIGWLIEEEIGGDAM
jgi:predicted ArsR family transcriptional regulator